MEENLKLKVGDTFKKVRSKKIFTFAYGNIWNGVIEVNGNIVRDKYGKLIETNK